MQSMRINPGHAEKHRKQKQHKCSRTNGTCGRTCRRLSARKTTEKSEIREGWLCQGWHWVTWIIGMWGIVAWDGTRKPECPENFKGRTSSMNHARSSNETPRTAYIQNFLRKGVVHPRVPEKKMRRDCTNGTHVMNATCCPTCVRNLRIG